MSRALLFPIAGAILAAAAAVFACNTASVQEAPPLSEDGGLCPTAAPVVRCDASAATTGCVPNPDSGIAAISQIPDQTYPFGCKVATYVINMTTGTCDISKECTCNDGGLDGWTCF